MPLGERRVGDEVINHFLFDIYIPVSPSLDCGRIVGNWARTHLLLGNPALVWFMWRFYPFWKSRVPDPSSAALAPTILAGIVGHEPERCRFSITDSVSTHWFHSVIGLYSFLRHHSSLSYNMIFYNNYRHIHGNSSVESLHAHFSKSFVYTHTFIHYNRVYVTLHPLRNKFFYYYLPMQQSSNSFSLCFLSSCTTFRTILCNSIVS